MTTKPELLEKALPEIRKALGQMANHGPARMCFLIGRSPFWVGKGPECNGPQGAVAEQLLHDLQREVWLDGFWTVIWFDYDYLHGQYGHLAWAYFDKDSDMLFFVDTEEPVEIIIMTIPDRVGDAYEAFQQWRAFERDLDITAADKIKAAQGQTSANPRARTSFDPFFN